MLTIFLRVVCLFRGHRWKFDHGGGYPTSTHWEKTNHYQCERCNAWDARIAYHDQHQSQ